MKGIWQGSGTWQTSGGGGGLVVVVLVLLLAGSGAAAVIAAAVIELIIAVAVVVALAVAGLIALAVYRARHPQVRPHFIPQPVMHQLAEPERPAIEAPGPRELHQHWHFHGVDEDRVAEILRRHQAPE